MREEAGVIVGDDLWRAGDGAPFRMGRCGQNRALGKICFQFQPVLQGEAPGAGILEHPVSKPADVFNGNAHKFCQSPATGVGFASARKCRDHENIGRERDIFHWTTQREILTSGRAVSDNNAKKALFAG
jgi:hypothetical protein